MTNTDKRNRLDEEVFSYRASKDGKVFIAWQGKQIMTLKGDKARKLLAQLADADHKQAQLALAKVTGNFKLLAQLADADHKQAQLALAKVTGNFKHGNERA